METHTLSTDIQSHLSMLQDLFPQAPDLVTCRFTIKQTGEHALLAYFDTLVDKNSINNNILHPLMTVADGTERPVSIGSRSRATDWTQVEQALLQAKSVLFVEGISQAELYDTQGWPQRAIEDPQVEASVKGAHQGFVETSSQNIALLRRYVPNRELKIREFRVGKRGNTTVSLLFLDDVAHPEVVEELAQRIQHTNVDSVLSSGALEEFLEDNSFSVFPQFMSTERPDAVASQVLQGRAAIVVDGSPAVLVGPVSFTSFFQSVDDYSVRWQVASFIRIMRFTAFLIAIFLPALYIAVISFHYEIVPLQLLLSLGQSRESVPYPPLVEALAMELSLEMLREAGIRLPAPIGQTVGIVGGIVIGQAAVQAGIVSNVMVIIVSLTAIASFIIPNFDMSAAIRLIRFPMMLVASLIGLVGIVAGAMVLLAHLVSLESVRMPYGTPVGPIRFADWKDTFVRVPLWMMKKRPRDLKPKQLWRQGRRRSRGDEP